MCLRAGWGLAEWILSPIAGFGGVERQWCREWVEGPAVIFPVLRARRFFWVSWVASVVCAVALMVTLLPSASWAEDPPTDPPKADASTPVTAVGTDFPSAVVQARATGKPVEITQERSEASTTWANPDGTLTTTQYGAPVRYQDDQGQWQSLDTTLEK